MKKHDLKRPALIIPLLNEVDAFPLLYTKLSDNWKNQIIAVDNGSNDGTRQWLSSNQIYTVHENNKGYGLACFTGVEAAKELGFKSIIFMDGDGSDSEKSLDRIEYQLKKNPNHFIFTRRRPHSGPWHAMIGTQLLLIIVWILWKTRFLDMGPMRGMTLLSLDRIAMTDRAYGWTLEMQIRVLQLGLPFLEIDVKSFPRAAGKSKISGTFWGSFHATKCLIAHIIKLKSYEIFKRKYKTLIEKTN
ncbi:MAG: glycosyltransferase [Bdellovibrionales bacterium]|nr:glycosyltransferase [Bdellovibrionales bacterium]